MFEKKTRENGRKLSRALPFCSYNVKVDKTNVNNVYLFYEFPWCLGQYKYIFYSLLLPVLFSFVSWAWNCVYYDNMKIHFLANWYIFTPVASSSSSKKAYTNPSLFKEIGMANSGPLKAVYMYIWGSNADIFLNLKSFYFLYIQEMYILRAYLNSTELLIWSKIVEVSGWKTHLQWPNQEAKCGNSPGKQTNNHLDKLNWTVAVETSFCITCRYYYYIRKRNTT